MKRILLLCLIGMVALNGSAATNNAAQTVQPFTAEFWTTTTLHSPTGKSFIFTRRTVYTRDAKGNTRREMYQPTKGLQHDPTAPLERVLTGSASALALPDAQSSRETAGQKVDLGTKLFSGLSATGTRQAFQNADSKRARMLETWFCATLGLTVHTESHDTRGDTVVGDLSDLHLGAPAPSSAETAAVVSPAIPSLVLYRSLFTQIAHMERDRLADDPNLHVNMAEIEDHLRKRIGLSAAEWQALVDKSVKVANYTRDMSKQAHTFADQDRATRQQNASSANTLTAGRATLHKMQLDLNTHVQGEIDDLTKTVGAAATDRIEAYLQGPLAASTHVVSAKTSRLQAQQAQKEQAR